MAIPNDRFRQTGEQQNTEEQLYVKNLIATLRYLPNINLIDVLRYAHSEDQYYILMEKGDRIKEWQPVAAHADKRLRK
jgi:hypothetical protein